MSMTPPRLAVAIYLTLSIAAAGCSVPGGDMSSPIEPETACDLAREKAATNPPFFAATTSWNVPVACLDDRADSSRWAHNWFNSATYLGRIDPTQRGAIDIAFDEYSTPIYNAAEATGNHRFFLTWWGHGDNLGAERTIPWNPAWRPAPGNDGEMLIVDHTTGREWGLWGVQPVNWSGCLTIGNLLAGYQPGVDICASMVTVAREPDGSFSDFRTSSGTSDGWGRGMGAIHGLALLPTLDEIENGSINHALNMETYGSMFGPACTPAQMATSAAGVSCGFATAPATRLEWFDGPAQYCGPVAQQNTDAARAQTVPPGMRFALNLTDTQIEAWLDNRGYSGPKRSTARIFAVALRDFGWIISDTSCWGSAIAVDGGANPASSARWAALGIIDHDQSEGRLLDGLITSASQVRAIEPPSPTPVLNR